MSDRQTNLDGLRGIAALVVVVVHGIIAFDFALYTGKPENSLTTWDIALSGAPLLLPMAGNLSVCVFFALSGYVLSQALSRSSLTVLPLILKRYVRFAIPMVSVCLLSWSLLSAGLMRNQELAAITKSTWLAAQMQQKASIEAAIEEGGLTALFQPAGFGASYDSSLWTMPIEFAGSIILIFVFAATRLFGANPKYQRQGQLFVFSLLAAVGCTSYLGLFAMGVLLGLTQIHRLISSGLALFLLGTGLFLGTIPYSAIPWSVVRPFVDWTYPTVPFIPYTYNDVAIFHSIGAIFILISSNSLPPFRKFLEYSPVQFLGQISFPLYLVHIPILMSIGSAIALALRRTGMPFSWVGISTVLALIALSVGFASALLLIAERPSIRLARQVGIASDRYYRIVTSRARQLMIGAKIS